MERLRLGLNKLLLPVLLPFCLFAAGCTGLQEASPVRVPFVAVKPEVTISPKLTDAPPHTVAVLPFSSLSKRPAGKDGKEEVDGRKILRDTFFGYFRVQPFNCVDIKTVDDILIRNRLVDIKAINDTPPEKYRELLNVDAVVYGDIKSASNFTGGVYSITELNGTLKLVDTRDREVLWQVKYFVKNTGGVISHSDQLLNIIDSQIENAKSTFSYVRCADTYCHTVISTLPQIKPIVLTPPVIEKIEIGPADKKSFKLFDSISVTLAGEKGLNAVFDIGSFKKGIPMLEISPGVYKGVYRVNRGDEVRDQYIAVKLTDLAGDRSNITASSSVVAIEAKPPLKVTNVAFKLDKNGDLALAWDPSESAGVKEYEIYRSSGYNFDYKLAGRTEAVSFKDELKKLHEGPQLFFYQIIAVDSNGNRSDASDPLKVE